MSRRIFPLDTRRAERRASTETVWAFYDGECQRCVRRVDRVRSVLHARGVRFVPTQMPWASERLHREGAPAGEKLHVVTPSGRLLGGAEAVVYLARRWSWTRPIAWLSGAPFFRARVRRAFLRRIATDESVEYSRRSRAVDGGLG